MDKDCEDSMPEPLEVLVCEAADTQFESIPIGPPEIPSPTLSNGLESASDQTTGGLPAIIFENIGHFYGEYI